MAISDGKALEDARRKKGWTQVQLSEATKPQINVSTISRIERGKSTRVRESTLKELGRALGVSPAALSTRSESERDLMRLRIESAARNALTLVALRYDVRREQIVEIAPFLFFIAAEQSLRKRLKRLGELRAAADAVYSAALPHLPPKAAVDETALDCEERSIAARDLFGTIVAENVGGPDDWDEGEGNPFARFLSDAVAEISGSAEAVRWTPGLWPSYEICADEAAAIVGGDATATRAILSGAAALHDMPKAPPAERAEWARAEFDSKYGYLDELLDEFRDPPQDKQGNSGPANSDDGAAP